jgi:membrane protein YdbS with pleckstrin-like domain
MNDEALTDPVPRNRVKEASRWIYRGVWAVLVRWFRVPPEPPTLPVVGGELPASFRPAAGFLNYLKLQFWIWLVIVNGAILIGWLVILAVSPMAGAILLPVALVLALLPDAVFFIALYLRYDTTWYVMTSRSLRVRRGIWIIHETTITFENVQNIKITQGPIQRIFGIADVLVETAGGGQGGDPSHGGGGGHGHQGLIEGIADAPRIRDLILSRLRETQTAGLGDEHEPHGGPAMPAMHSAWGPAQLALLREIRDAARRLAA